MDIRKQFAKNLHRALSIRGIKQVDFAGVIQVPPTTLNGWMRGSHLPDLEMLLVISDYLDMPAGELIGDPRHPAISKEEKNFRDEYAKQYRQVENLIERNKELERYIAELKRENVKMQNTTREISLLDELRGAGVKEAYLKF